MSSWGFWGFGVLGPTDSLITKSIPASLTNLTLYKLTDTIQPHLTQLLSLSVEFIYSKEAIANLPNLTKLIVMDTHNYTTLELEELPSLRSLSIKQ